MTLLDGPEKRAKWLRANWRGTKGRSGEAMRECEGKIMTTTVADENLSEIHLADYSRLAQDPAKDEVDEPPKGEETGDVGRTLSVSEEQTGVEEAVCEAFELYLEWRPDAGWENFLSFVKDIPDLRRAAWYVNREIARRQPPVQKKETTG